MTHRFVILVDGILKTYNEYDSIPDSFDNVIEFRPCVSPGPHTDEQHEEIEQWNERLRELIKRERNHASSNKSR